jgi:hypothetical protein
MTNDYQKKQKCFSHINLLKATTAEAMKSADFNFAQL